MKLWKENRTDQEWELSTSEIVDRFMASPYNSKEFFNNMRLERIIRLFLTSKDGLNSVFEESDYEEVHEAIGERVFPQRKLKPGNPNLQKPIS